MDCAVLSTQSSRDAKGAVAASTKLSCRQAKGLSGIFFVWGKIADMAQAPFRNASGASDSELLHSQ
jgi:hypothetical protein